ncbi:hypothetical protein [Terracidiphilus sp.]|uniref:hypothetical protein n=1 Tax=Terracidiphilus sp. TaxID=1964191 RepID=UPI003C24ACEF
MTSEEIHEAMHRALEIVDRQIADGTLDQSGRFYSDEELEAQRAALAAGKAAQKSKVSAA